ncbi:MAG: tRNA (guanosine(37)-N1)-methyltransferase TrmD [Lachnospiraceae bacterium]|nr:tRNA (guanosine(37)-N1)-methyltransferase TrmD [Lachnospiraceae bacterium]
MTFDICTLFPEMFETFTKTSIIGRAVAQGLIGVCTHQIREYSADEKHRKVDDYTYGGGAGMLMQAQPVYDCVSAVLGKADAGDRTHVIYLTPQGRVLTQEVAKELTAYDRLVLLCGHYEGVDERALEALDADGISIGDYVLSGGELAAMVLTDTVARLLPGVLGNEESAQTESFDEGLLEYPQYTRPEVWMEKRVPQILISGDHKKVDEWRREQALQRTKERRPDLYAAYQKRQEADG